MTAEEFKKANNFRQCERCCGNCRLWRDHMYEGDGDCVHPDVKDNFLCTQADDVCDKWEKDCS